MALNVTWPLTGVPDILKRCNLLSELLDSEADDVPELLTPYDSNESLFETSDSQDIEIGTSSSEKDAPISPSSSLSSSAQPTSPIKERPFCDIKIEYQGRDILDLANNIMERNNPWNFQYARLPENNLSMFMANDYDRVDPDGQYQESNMALNVALPLSGLPEYIERCGIFSPLPDLEENLQLLVTPYSSSESGIGSSDCDDNKNQTSSASEKDVQISPLMLPQPMSTSTSPIKEQSFCDKKFMYQGRDILDLANNIMEKNNPWKFQYARLPENNLRMFMHNRSQYHRLGPNGHIREYDLATCNRCTFQFPFNSSIPNNISNDDGAIDAIAKSTQSNEKAQMLPSFKIYKHF